MFLPDEGKDFINQEAGDKDLRGYHFHNVAKLILE